MKLGKDAPEPKLLKSRRSDTSSGLEGALLSQDADVFDIVVIAGMARPGLTTICGPGILAILMVR